MNQIQVEEFGIVVVVGPREEDLLNAGFRLIRILLTFLLTCSVASVLINKLFFFFVIIVL